MKRILIADKGDFQATYTRGIQRLGLDLETVYVPNEEIARFKINSEPLELALVAQEMEGSKLVVLAADSRQIPTAVLYYLNPEKERFNNYKVLGFLDKSDFPAIADFLKNFFSQQKTNQ